MPGSTLATRPTAGREPVADKEGPERASQILARALSAGDLRIATDCFVKDACLVTPDRTAIRGRQEIRPILAQLIDGGCHIEVLASTLLVADDLALGTERWETRSAGASGAVLAQESTATMVLRRTEGTWKIAIAAPWDGGYRRGH
jgi:ketosteroid isomerase-like protein